MPQLCPKKLVRVNTDYFLPSDPSPADPNGRCDRSARRECPAEKSNAELLARSEQDTVRHAALSDADKERYVRDEIAQRKREHDAKLEGMFLINGRRPDGRLPDGSLPR